MFLFTYSEIQWPSGGKRTVYCASGRKTEILILSSDCLKEHHNNSKTCKTRMPTNTLQAQAAQFQNRLPCQQGKVLLQVHCTAFDLMHDSKVPLVWNQLTTKASTAWSLLYSLPQNTDTSHIAQLWHSFACIPSFLTGNSDVPKKSNCGRSWSFRRKLKHQTINQWHIMGKTYRARQQGRQNAEWTEFAILGGFLVIIDSLQHWLTRQRSIMYPTHTAKLTETQFCFSTRASDMSETTRSRDITHWATFFGSPSWSSLFYRPLSQAAAAENL